MSSARKLNRSMCFLQAEEPDQSFFGVPLSIRTVGKDFGVFVCGIVDEFKYISQHKIAK